MFISFTSGGQTGNQLIYSVNIMASSIEYNIDYKNISFKAIEYFDVADINFKNKNVWYPKISAC